MISSLEVGAILRVIDEASPALQRISESFERLDALVKRFKGSLATIRISPETAASIKGFNDQLLAIGTSADKGAAGAATAFGDIDKSILATQERVIALKREMSTVGGIGSVGSRTIGPGGQVLPHGGGGGGRGGWAHVGRMGVGPEGVRAPHMSLPSGPVMAGVAALGYGAWLEAEMDDAVFQLEYHAGLKSTPENNDKFRSIIQGAMSKTGKSLKEVTDAAKQEIRMFVGTPGGGIDVLPEMLQAAATESRLKGTSVEESMTALIGLSHMTKEYGPDAIKKLAPAFAFLSSSNPSSLGSMEKAASYAVPILQSGMEIDPMQTLLLGTALTRAGATNSKSGTWLRNMMLNSMPGTSLMSKIAFEKHEEALKALGLVDDKNNPTWFTNGKPDPFKMLGIASEHAADIPLTKRAAYEKQLFGSQGFGGFALLADPAVRQQVGALGTEMNSDAFKNRYANFLDDYKANSPLQAGRVLGADAQNALMDLGKTILPAFTATIKEADSEIHGWETTIRGLGADFRAAESAVRGFTGAIGGAVSGVAAAISGAFHGGPAAGALPPLTGQPRHPSGLAPLDPHYPGKQASNGTPVNVKTAIYLDGKVIGQSTSSQFASSSQFPRQAAVGDSYSGWWAPDGNATA
jgi:hypothetical protein